MESVAAATVVNGPAEAFAVFQQEVLGHGLELTDGLYHEDIVVEFPFARPGGPTRVLGREMFAAMVRAGRQGLAGRLDEFRDVVVRVDRERDLIAAPLPVQQLTIAEAEQCAGTGRTPISPLEHRHTTR